MVSNFHLYIKSAEVCIETKSTPALLPFNPLTSNIKEQFLLSCPHTFLVKVLVLQGCQPPTSSNMENMTSQPATTKRLTVPCHQG